MRRPLPWGDVGAAIGLAVAWVALCLIFGLGLRLAVEILLFAFAAAAAR